MDLPPVSQAERPHEPPLAAYDLLQPQERPTPLQPSPVVLGQLPQVQLTLRARSASSSHSACGKSGSEKNSSHTELANSSHGGTSQKP